MSDAANPFDAIRTALKNYAKARGVPEPAAVRLKIDAAEKTHMRTLEELVARRSDARRYRELFDESRARVAELECPRDDISERGKDRAHHEEMHIELSALRARIAELEKETEGYRRY